jgi:D-alanyl-D-alanine carboxypeptidase
MITTDEFVKKYNGEPIDWDGSYGNQCMDLMLQYVNDVLGIPGAPLGAATAYQSFVNGHYLFDKFIYSSGSRPQTGDIIYWDTTVGFAGHVAVVVSAGNDSFISFDQNWPVGSVCHEQQHDYTGVAGWLRLKTNDTPMTTEERQEFDDIKKEVKEIKKSLANKITEEEAVDQIKSRTTPARSILKKVAKKLGYKYNPKIKKNK